MALNIVGTVYIVLSAIIVFAFQCIDQNFKPPIYQNLVFFIMAALAIIAIWR